MPAGFTNDNYHARACKVSPTDSEQGISTPEHWQGIYGAYARRIHGLGSFKLLTVRRLRESASES
jgi:hypothetical protein